MRKVSLCLCFVVLLAALPDLGAAETPASRPLRVGLLTGGGFQDYQAVFKGLARGLEDRGLIANGLVPIPENNADLAPMWAWMIANAGGDKLIFAEDAFYSCNWDKDARARVAGEIIERVRRKKDLDVLLAFGTWAGQDLATGKLDLPVLVSSVTDAVEAGIIVSAEDSGQDNLWAGVDPGRFPNQLRLFHDIFHFKRLGLAYDSSPLAGDAIALQEIEGAAEGLGVELLRCTAAMDIPDANLAADRLRDCHEKLAAQGAEAVYITFNVGMKPERIPDVLAPLVKARIPTFSQAGAEEVRRGVLLSMAGANILDEGDVSAAALAEIVLKGKKPREISQFIEVPVSLAINLRTAALIGWNLPMDILAAVDEFYQDF